MRTVRTGYGAVMGWVSVWWLCGAAGIAWLAVRDGVYAGLVIPALIAVAAFVLGLPRLGLRLDRQRRRLAIRQPNCWVELDFDEIAVVEFPPRRRSFSPFPQALAVVTSSGDRHVAYLVCEGYVVSSTRLSTLRDMFQTEGVPCRSRTPPGWW